MEYDYLDIDRLFRTIYGEARSETHMGKLAVGYVVCNRAKIAKEYYEKHKRGHPLYGSGTPASACTMPYQFSCWNLDDPNLEIIIALKADSPKMTPYIKAAREALAETEPDPTNRATHYHTMDILPDWAVGQIPTVTIGHHKFYNLG